MPRLYRRCDVASNESLWEYPPVFLLSTTSMQADTAIQFTQDQMRTLTGVSTETVRHWRKAVP